MREAVVDLSAQPLRNLHRNPSGVGMGNGGTMTAYWSGISPNVVVGSDVDVPWSLFGRAGRLTWTTRTSFSGDIGMTIMTGDPAMAQIAGRKVTAVFDIVASVGGWNLGEMIVGNLIPNANATIHASSPTGRAVAAGVPMRCWVTFTAPVTTTAIGSVRINLGGLPLTAGVYVEASNYDFYFGDYVPTRQPASGDSPGWRWIGAPNSSESVGYPWTLDPNLVRQKVSNLAQNPSAKLSATGFSFSSQTGSGTITRLSGGGPTGGWCVRRTWTGTGTAVGGEDILTYGMTAWGGQGIPAAIPTVAGRTYTLSVMVRPSRDAPLRIQAQSILGSGGGTGIPNPPNVTCPANVWTRLAMTVTVPSGAPSLRLDVDNAATGANPVAWQVGDTIDFTNVMITEGSDPGYYADGDTPGWSWTGTNGESVSTGYPYTLEQIAGKPLASLEGIGGVPVPDLPPFQGRTLYAVFDVINDQDAYVLVSAWNGGLTATSGGFRIQTGNTGSPTVGARVDTGNGQSNATLGTSGNRTPGRHVMCLSINDGMTQARVLSDNLAEATRTINPGDGLVYTNSVLSAFNNPGTKTIISHAYDIEHDEATRKNIMGWLARKYGATAPTGY